MTRNKFVLFDVVNLSSQHGRLALDLKLANICSGSMFILRTPVTHDSLPVTHDCLSVSHDFVFLCIALSILTPTALCL